MKKMYREHLFAYDKTALCSQVHFALLQSQWIKLKLQGQNIISLAFLIVVYYEEIFGFIFFSIEPNLLIRKYIVMIVIFMGHCKIFYVSVKRVFDEK